MARTQADFMGPLRDAIQGCHIAPMTADERTSVWLAAQAGPSLASKVSRRLGQAFGRPEPTRDGDRAPRH